MCIYCFNFQLKLESSTPKAKCEMPLEEEKSTDFVFIPLEVKETKERILTEHQKEVLKTKRFVVLLSWIEFSVLTFRFHAANVILSLELR